jgi:uncharacterized surface protein with fasciclin (FAS1) repeats
MRFSRLTAAVLLLILTASLVLFAATSTTPKMMDLVGTAAKTPTLSMFVKAVNAAGLTAALKQPGPYTVFAPTNAAFQKIPAATRANLMKPANKAMLKNILLYHVIKGKVTSAQVMKMKNKTMVATLEGQKVTISHSATRIMVNNAMVVKPDIMATNGVIHEIDTVLMPPKTK